MLCCGPLGWSVALKGPAQRDEQIFAAWRKTYFTGTEMTGQVYLYLCLFDSVCLLGSVSASLSVCKSVCVFLSGGSVVAGLSIYI